MLLMPPETEEGSNGADSEKSHPRYRAFLSAANDIARS
jgi:hypothetical protein